MPNSFSKVIKILVLFSLLFFIFLKEDRLNNAGLPVSTPVQHWHWIFILGLRHFLPNFTTSLCESLSLSHFPLHPSELLLSHNLVDSDQRDHSAQHSSSHTVSCSFCLTSDQISAQASLFTFLKRESGSDHHL